ncbi:hypothetical protein HOU00_gp078 [Caulobacter phage CcrPW]|uniref:Uncharacterized protein n=1 Tax=Caulobacter phage CcrPW TaxID=2283271 RepID=A0A385ECS3_9CAUD|nr:hypothetical protein HOU00_gp078 [Caulobacter phage CcrPW]AXQ68617.1 hypothetical protein CcrPW_gp078 [Caulobacter phage CcrPW]
MQWHASIQLRGDQLLLLLMGMRMESHPALVRQAKLTDEKFRDLTIA